MKVAQSCLTLCNPMNYTVHGSPGQNTGMGSHTLLSRGSSQPRDGTQASHIAGRFFAFWAIGEGRLAAYGHTSWGIEKKKTKKTRIYKIHKDVEKEKNVCVCVFVCVCVCLCPADYTAMRVALSSLVLMGLTDILTWPTELATSLQQFFVFLSR